jgi:ABC-type iron transport system FetAB permease component
MFVYEFEHLESIKNLRIKSIRSITTDVSVSWNKLCWCYEASSAVVIFIVFLFSASIQASLLQRERNYLYLYIATIFVHVYLAANC